MKPDPMLISISHRPIRNQLTLRLKVIFEFANSPKLFGRVGTHERVRCLLLGNRRRDRHLRRRGVMPILCRFRTKSAHAIEQFLDFGVVGFDGEREFQVAFCVLMASVDEGVVGQSE